MIFSEKDIIEIEKHGLTTETIEAQVARIKSGMTFSKLKEAATVGKGILKIEEDQESYYIDLFDKKSSDLSMAKFVPASGAATRMFKFLFQFLNTYDVKEESLSSFIERHNLTALSKFLNELEAFPFFEEVVHKTHKIISNFNELSYDERSVEFVKTMLNEDRLNYGFYPKGLLPFHRYKQYVSTAFEEHLYEGVRYASANKKADLHFTISEIHHTKFNQELDHIEDEVVENTGNKFEITFSYQKKSTDTVALTMDNELFRDSEGNILFRPSGHGALLENLNDLDYDIIFIKNVDNVVVKDAHETVSRYKKLLAGVLLEVQEQTFKFLHELETEDLKERDLSIIKEFLINKLNVVVPSGYETNSLELKKDYLKEKLNRPIRVCGMVKNQGEPGGGPFWVEDETGSMSLQIVESAQIDLSSEHQKNILKSATHFNPVDLVCGVRNYKGEPFDLTQYVNHNTAFITKKNHAGTDIKTLELPGLWNGSMACWNTIFVEVPLSTFNPVKTVNDLLRSSHQLSK